MTNSEWCVSHDPARQVINKMHSARGGRKAGRGRASSELVRLQKRFEDLADQIEAELIERSIGLAVAQVLNFARACVRDGLVAQEQEQLVERMELLEEQLDEQSKRRSTGAWGGA